MRFWILFVAILPLLSVFGWLVCLICFLVHRLEPYYSLAYHLDIAEVYYSKLERMQCVVQETCQRSKKQTNKFEQFFTNKFEHSYYVTCRVLVGGENSMFTGGQDESPLFSNFSFEQQVWKDKLGYSWGSDLYADWFDKKETVNSFIGNLTTGSVIPCWNFSAWSTVQGKYQGEFLEHFHTVSLHDSAPQIALGLARGSYLSARGIMIFGSVWEPFCLAFFVIVVIRVKKQKEREGNHEEKMDVEAGNSNQVQQEIDEVVSYKRKNPSCPPLKDESSEISTTGPSIKPFDEEKRSEPIEVFKPPQAKIPKRSNKKKIVPTQEKTPKSIPQSDNEDDLCCVCLYKQKTVLLLPCKHMCLCSGCSAPEKCLVECPLCKVVIFERINVYR